MSYAARRGSAVLGLFLLIGVGVLVTLGAMSIHQLVGTQSHYTITTWASQTQVSLYTPDQGGPETTQLVMFTPGPLQSVSGFTARHAVAEATQRTVPTIVLVVVLLGLFIGILVAAVRGGVYAATTRLLMRIGGWVALVAGPVAVTIETATRGGDSSAGGVPWWAQLFVWLLIGSGLLAGRELLGRAADMRTELSEVI